jgi:hypothetical protein
MPQVKAKTTCFIDNSLRNEGDVFEYNGTPNTNVVLVGAAGEEVADEPKVKQKWSPKAKRNAEDLG